MKRASATTTPAAAAPPRPPGAVRLHHLPLRRVLALPEGRRAVHRRPSRRGRLPDGGGARAPRVDVLQHRRALLAGARLRGLPRAAAGRPRGVPPPGRAPNGGGPAAPTAAAAPLFSLDQTEYETALATDHVNVEETARKLSRRDMEAAVEAITGAERVLIAGTDQMAFFASYLRHLLMLLDIRAEVVASPSQEALGRLARIDETTLVIGLSAGRPHPLIARTMKLARHRRAPTLAITDATLSEVAQARAHPPVLLVEQPRVRALARRIVVDAAGPRLRRLCARRAAVRDAHQGLPAQVVAELRSATYSPCCARPTRPCSS